ncbi:MAG: N-acetylmuramoyl-L-alanine amidase, partial [Rhodothermales bacterium]|nr:N-acetylmuramoyl-L-alanine amidase [Rhodothermales bacterium]
MRTLRTTLLGAILTCMSVGFVQASEPVVQRVSVTPTSAGDGYVVRIHSSDYIHAYSNARELGSRKYEIILFNTDLVSPYRHEKPAGPLVSYLFETRDDHLVFSFQLVDNVNFAVSVYRDRETNDLLVGLIHDGEAVPVRPVKVAPPVPVGPSIQARDRWRLDTIVIDPGHGGKDPGARAHGSNEKDVALAVALKLGEYLKDLGVNVVYTREDDRFVELKQRGKIANEAGGKLFISIHANAQRRGGTARG